MTFLKANFSPQLLGLESISGVVHNERFISFPNAFTTRQMSTRTHQSAVVFLWPFWGCYHPRSITEETCHRTDCSWHAGSQGGRSHQPGVGKGVQLKSKVTTRTDINHLGMVSEIYCFLRLPSVAQAFKPPLICCEIIWKECSTCTFNSHGTIPWLVWTQFFVSRSY